MVSYIWPGVASRAEAWIEVQCHSVMTWGAGRRLPCGGVDRSPQMGSGCSATSGRRLPCGDVDRNSRSTTTSTLPLSVASRAEAWIETPSDRDTLNQYVVASRAEAWIETQKA